MKVVVLAALALFACGEDRGPADGPPYVPGASLPLDDPRLVEGTLDNGVHFVIHPVAGALRAHLRLVISAGSLAEDDDQRGLAHLVEHLAFEGTTHFPGRTITDFIERTGMQFGADLNAETSFDSTVYRLAVPADRPAALATGLDVLRDWASELTFDPAAIDRERRVVEEERRFRAAPARFDRVIFEYLTRATRYATRDPIGDPDVIAHAPRDAMLRFYRDWYRPDLMTVVAVGDFDARAIERGIRARFATLRPATHARAQARAAVHVRDGEVTFVPEGDERTEMAAIVEELPCPRTLTLGELRRAVADELRSRARTIEAANEFPLSKTQYALGDLIVAVVQGPRMLVTGDLATSRFGDLDPAAIARARRELLDDTARPVDPSARAERLATAIVSHALGGRFVVDSATWNAWARVLAPGIGDTEIARAPRGAAALVVRVASALVYDDSPDGRRNEQRLRDAFAQARAATPTSAAAAEARAASATRRSEREATVFPHPVPPRGTIVSTRTFAAQGVVEWRLSNGARVVSKRIATPPHDVELLAVAPGGAALAPPAQRAAARIASDVVWPADLPEAWTSAYDRHAAALAVGADAWVEIQPGAIRLHAGATSPAKIEAALQVLVATVARPRARPDPRGSLRAGLGTQPQLPAFPYTLPDLDDALWRIAVANDPLQTELSPSAATAASTDAAVAFYRDHVADLGGYTFVLIGDVDPATLRPLLEQYLAGTPPTGASRLVPDTGFRWATGDVTVEHHSTVRDDRSIVRLDAWTDISSEFQAREDVELLLAVVRLRMLRLLRGELAEVYTVSARAVEMAPPARGWWFELSFSCAPGNARPLADALRADLKAMRDGAIAVDDVVKAREQRRRAAEVAQLDAYYWRDQLAGAYLLGADASAVDPGTLVHAPVVDDEAARVRVQALAHRYLSFDGTATGILNPAAAAK